MPRPQTCQRPSAARSTSAPHLAAWQAAVASTSSPSSKPSITCFPPPPARRASAPGARSTCRRAPVRRRSGPRSAVRSGWSFKAGGLSRWFARASPHQSLSQPPAAPAADSPPCRQTGGAASEGAVNFAFDSASRDRGNCSPISLGTLRWHRNRRRCRGQGRLGRQALCQKLRRQILRPARKIPIICPKCGTRVQSRRTEGALAHARAGEAQGRRRPPKPVAEADDYGQGRGLGGAEPGRGSKADAARCRR